MEQTWDTIFRDYTRLCVQFVLVPLVVTIGVLGNAATILILTKKQSQRLPSNVYLTALAFSDLLFLFFTFFMSFKHYAFIKSFKPYWSYLPLGLWITDASNCVSVWLTVCFTVERYFAICHPTTIAAMSTVKRAKSVSICVYIACFLLTFSTFWEWKATTVKQEIINATAITFVLENTEFGSNPWYRLLYYWFTTIIFVFVPVAILAIGNYFLIDAVRTSRNVRNTMTICHHQGQLMRREDRITTTLIVIVVIFLICQMPTVVVLIYTSMYTPKKESVEDNVLLGLGNIFNLLVAVNAACNFILYTALSDKYRKEFFKFFCFSPFSRQWKKSRQQQTLCTLPNVLTAQERLRFAQQQEMEFQEDSFLSINSNSFKDLYLKHVLTLEKCVECVENRSRDCFFSEVGT